MSGLSSALSHALSGLVVTQGQTAVVSRNITRASEEDYTRKVLDLKTDFSGNARAANIRRVTESRLVAAVGDSNSAMAGQQVRSEALARLSETVGDVEADGSIAWGIGQLEIALSEFEASPNSFAAANNAVAQAQNLAQSLVSASGIVGSLRREADANIASAVANTTSILSEIEDLNSRITGGRVDSGTLAELLDKRDAALGKLSAEMGVRTVERANNGIAIYTDSGVTLFDVTARSVTFNPSTSLSPGASGNSVYIDGVQVTGVGALMPLRNGRISASVEVRDVLAPNYQSHLDEIARTLVTQFAETEQNPVPTSSALTGLFGYSGSPTVPAAATLVPGIAAEINVNPSFDAGQGGNPMLLRDGGANGFAYLYNLAGSSGFQDRLSGLIESLGSPTGFDPAAGLSANANIKSFASSSAGWIEQKRSEARKSLDTFNATHQRASDALAKKSGVNIDEEMVTLLNLEKSYQAAAKVVTTVDQMLATLMQIVR